MERKVTFVHYDATATAHSESSVRLQGETLVNGKPLTKPSRITLDDVIEWFIGGLIVLPVPLAIVIGHLKAAGVL
ncbi:MAG: hypothetical protein AAGE92_06715 [Cyanobacteria bacterium P01_G01_bin.4]